MTKEEILKRVDHTNLKQIATFKDIKKLCDEGIKYNVASICIPPCYVKDTKKYVKGKIKVCTVIGFPNGYSTTDTKVYETREAIKDGADEIDMVINIGYLKDKKYDDIKKEINLVKKECNGNILKVIIETCLLSDEEKVKTCEIISESDANYIKTSTGFSTGGATLKDIELFKNHLKNSKIKIKAAGGIGNFEVAELMINNGADRLGTSKLVKLMK